MWPFSLIWMTYNNNTQNPVRGFWIEGSGVMWVYNPQPKSLSAIWKADSFCLSLFCDSGANSEVWRRRSTCSLSFFSFSFFVVVICLVALINHLKVNYSMLFSLLPTLIICKQSNLFSENFTSDN